MSTPSQPTSGPTSGPTPQPASVGRGELDQIVRGDHGHPHAVLGPHVHEGVTTFRVLKPLAERVLVRHDGGDTVLEHEHGGIWVGAVASSEVPDYRVVVDYGQGEIVVDDPYRFLPTLGEVDLHLVNEGRHENLWQVLGARVQSYDVPGGEPITGTSFAVWAPSARALRIKGDFNSWDGREHPMRQLGQSGVWELFVPGVASGTSYKFVVLGADDVWREKADPMAFHAEVAPATSSRVHESTHVWGDEAWMAARAEKQPIDEPMSTYELHLGSWKRHPGGGFWSYDEMADDLVPYLSNLGFTHVELMPVMQHPFGGSWGYHVTSYFAPDSRYGDPDGFKRLVDRFHQAGIGVILDWVPGHFATDEWALVNFDGTPLYEDPNPQRG
ncbi:GlgB N-terminal domain-containing protein, partial [Nocardioides sp.]|uniref:GlgB N-terminal domain-containing protein n=1 Tax=Nocardioides sp. TaxID=35761 RepID=UPI002B275861